jgi:predicted esterase
MGARIPAIFLVATAALACESGSAAPDASPGPALALFEVPRPGAPPASGFYALPFPNDLRVGEDGRVDLSDHARPNAIIGEYLDVIADRQRGFGMNSAVFFRFSEQIDPASLPQTPEASLGEGASVYLVNVDPESAARGQKTPLRFRFERFAGEAIGDNWLSALPYPGFPLGEGTTYAVVVTRRVLGADGGPVVRGPDFDAIAGDAGLSDPALVRARAVYAPLLEWLDEEGGDERADVVAAALFTTARATDLLGRIREVIWRDLPAPEPRAVTWIRTTPDLAFYEGVYDGPVFQSGDVPYQRIENGGEILTDADTGDPLLERMEELRFALTVPPGKVPPEGWPVALYAHGTGGDYKSFFRDGTGARLAREGIAVISIDQVLHGPRNPNASPEISFFNFGNPLAARDNVLQGALDDFQLIRLVLNFRFTERHAGGRTIRFDPGRIFFFGHSQGGLTGVPFCAHEPLIKGAVFSGAGGLLYLSMLHKTEPVDVAGLVSAFIRDFPLDEFNPILAVLQMWVDRADPVAYGPLLVEQPLPPAGPRHVFLSLGIEDRFTPVPTIEALAAALRLDHVGPVVRELPALELAGGLFLQPPVSANRQGVTAAVLQYEERPGSDGHFVIFNVPEAQQQSIQFLATLANEGTATVVAP